MCAPRLSGCLAIQPTRRADIPAADSLYRSDATSPNIVKNLCPNSRSVSTNLAAFNPTASKHFTVRGVSSAPFSSWIARAVSCKQSDIVVKAHRQRLRGPRPRALGPRLLARERHEPCDPLPRTPG